MYILIKEYGDAENQIIQYSDKPFLIEDIELDYKNGLTYVVTGRTINLPYLKERALFDKKEYIIGNPLTEEEENEKLKNLMDGNLTIVESGKRVRFKKPRAKLRGIQSYNGDEWLFVKPHQVIIPIVDIINGHYIEGFSKRVYESQLFGEILGKDHNNPNRRIVSDMYKTSQMQLEEEQMQDDFETHEENLTDGEVKQNKGATPKRRK